MPDLTPAHEALHRLIGVWEGTEKLIQGGAITGTATGRQVFRLGLGGLAVIQDYVQWQPDGTCFEFHGVLTVDPHAGQEEQAGQVVWYGFNSLDPLPGEPARGEWYGSTLGLERHLPGVVVRHRLTVAGDVLNIVHARRAAEETDDDFAVFFDGTYVRQQAG